MQGGYCLSVRAALIQGHGSERPPLFVPVLSFFQPFHDLPTLAREAPSQSVAVKGEGYSRAKGSWLNTGHSAHLHSSHILLFHTFHKFTHLKIMIFHFMFPPSCFCALSGSFVETNQQRLADIVHVARGGWQWSLAPGWQSRCPSLDDSPN